MYALDSIGAVGFGFAPEALKGGKEALEFGNAFDCIHTDFFSI